MFELLLSANQLAGVGAGVETEGCISGDRQIFICETNGR